MQSFGFQAVLVSPVLGIARQHHLEISRNKCTGRTAEEPALGTACSTTSKDPLFALISLQEGSGGQLMLSGITGSVWSKGVKSFLQPKRRAESETRSHGGDGMLLHTCFFLTANTSAHTLILHGHTHTGLSSRENPHSTGALQKLINVPIRGISRLAFHYKAGVFSGRDGHRFMDSSAGIAG